MSALIYYTHRALQEYAPELLDRLGYDQAQCEVGVTCHRSIPHPLPLHAPYEYNAGVGVVAAGDDDHPEWVPVVVLTNPHDADKPLLACEDCANWLAEVFGSTVQDVEDV